MQISLPEPLLQWLPREDKGPAARFVPWLLSPLLYAAIFPMDCVIRMSRDGGPKVHDLIPLLLPAAMLVLTGPGHVVNTLLLWLVVIVSNCRELLSFTSNQRQISLK